MLPLIIKDGLFLSYVGAVILFVAVALFLMDRLETTKQYQEEAKSKTLLKSFLTVMVSKVFSLI